MTSKPRKGKAKKCGCFCHTEKFVGKGLHCKLCDPDFEAVKTMAKVIADNFPADPSKPFQCDHGRSPRGCPDCLVRASQEAKTAIKHIHVTEPAPQERDHRRCRRVYLMTVCTWAIFTSVSWMYQWHHWSALWDQQKGVYIRVWEREMLHMGVVRSELYDECQSDYRKMIREGCSP